MRRLFVLREARHLQALDTFLKSNWKAFADQGKPLVLEIRPEGIQRSKDQNRYYWQMMQQISEKAWIEGQQYHRETWHEAAKRQFLPLIDLPFGGFMSTSTTELTKEDMTEYIRKVDHWAQHELGVEFEDLIDWKG